MKKFIIPMTVWFMSLNAHAQRTADRIMYGAITKDSLLQEPFAKWFSKGFAEYHVNTEAKQQISRLPVKDIRIEIFFGTWCGDSKREVPRFLKMLEEINFSLSSVKLVCVGNSDSLYKQSPGGEEKGKGIFRVPCFIFSRNGTEIGRINEFPALSLEKDLLSILEGQNYSPNYKSFATVKRWINEGIFADSNITARSLAMQLRPLVSSEHELNSLAYVLLKQDLKKEALMVFRINANLYPESANVFSSLGEGYLRNGDNTKAVSALETSIGLNKDPALLKDILALLYEAKGVK